MKAPWGPIGSAKVTAQNQASSVWGIRVTDEKQRQARTAEADLAVYLSGRTVVQLTSVRLQQQQSRQSIFSTVLRHRSRGALTVLM